MSNSTNVETNVVQMRFDNKNFEKNVSQTMDSLDKLKKELKFDDSAKSFKTLEENAKKVDFSPLSKGIEKVQASFSFLDTFSATVYHRLSNRLIDLGKKVVSSVSTEGVKSGFSEYELKMNSFKTIKASAGKDFTDSKINEYLEELNKYADRTIYSFSDMTNNIGKFTNAGVKLDVAVKAIRGISNEAAVSGANAEQASHAMYNFSQALSSGYVKLIDWKSIEIANMATEEFKNELIKTAASVGTLTKAQNGMYKTQKGKLLNSTLGFNEALQDQWMTTEVLTKTLEKYADETTDIGKKAFDAAQKVNTFSKLMDTLKESIQSGWARIWELVIGDLDQATALWTSISDAVGKFIDKRFGPLIKMLEDWNEQHGRADALKAIGDMLKAIGELLKPIGRAFRDIFPKKTINDLLEMTGALEDFAKKVKPTTKQSKKLQDTFRGIFAAVDIVRMAIGAFKKTFGGVFIKILGDALHSLFGVTGSFGDMLVAVRKNIKENDTFNKVLKPIADTLLWVYGIIKKVAGVIWDFAGTIKDAVTSLGGLKSIGGWFENFKDAIVNFNIGDIASSIWSLFENIGKFIDDVMAKTFDFYTPLKEKFKDAWDKLKNSKVIKGITEFCKGIVDDIQGMFDNMRDVDTSGADELAEETKKKFSFMDAISKVLEFFSKVWEKIKNIAKTIWPYIKSVFKSLGKGIQMLWEGITTNIKNSDMGDAGGLLGGIGVAGLGIGIKNFIDQIKPLVSSFKMLTNGGVLKNVFNILTGATRLIKAKILKEIAVSMILLVGAIFLLCTLPKEKVIGATVAMGILFQGLTSVFNSIDSGAGDSGMENEGKKINTRLFGAAAMIAALAVAMLILTVALRKLAKYKTEDLTKAIIVIGVLFKIISSTIKSILNAGQQVAGSKAGSVSIAVTGVAQTIKSLGKCLLLIAAACWILSKAAQDSEGEFRAERIIVPLLALSVVIGIIGVIVVKLQEKIKQTDTEISANKYKGILEGKAGMALTIVALAVFIKQFAKAMLILFAAIAAVAIIAHFTGWGQLWASFALMATTIVGVLAAMLGTVAILTKIADKFNGKDGKGGLGKLAILIGIVSLFINSIAILFGTLSLIPSDWAATGSGVLLAISASILLVMEGISAVVEASKEAEGALKPKAIVAILGTVTLAIAAIVGCVIALAKTLKDTNPTKAILILSGIAIAIGSIIFAISKWGKVAKAFEVFTKGIAAFGIAAAGFALAALLIITTLSKVSKMSDSEISQIGKNMQKVTTAILSSSDQLVGMIMGLVRNVIKTVVETAIFTILDSAETILEGLIGLCDKLLLQAPTLVNKILQILVEVLTELERSMGPLVVQVVSFVATLISDVAQAIVDNADKITKAIDDVITAITTLVVGSVAKILGIDQFKNGINTLIKIIKPFTAALIGMFAYKKVKTGAYSVIKILSAFKTKILTFVTTLRSQGMKNAWKEFLGIDKLNEAWERATLAHERGMASTGTIIKNGGAAILKAAGIGATIGIALGSVVASFIKAKEDAIDVEHNLTASIDKEFADLEDRIDEHNKNIKEKRKETNDAIFGVDSKYDTTSRKLHKLNSLIDSNGRIKKGKEEEAKNLTEDINSELGDRLLIEDNILKMLDEQGKARKFELEQLQAIIETERLRAKVQEKQKRKEEIQKEGGELDEANKNLENAKKKYDEYKEKADNYANTLKAWNEERKELETLYANRTDSEEAFKKYSESLQAFNKKWQVWMGINDTENITDGIKKKALDDIQTELEKNSDINRLAPDVVYEYDKALKIKQSLIDEVNQIEDAERALETGVIEDIHKMNLTLSGVYNEKLSKSQKEEKAKQFAEEVEKGISDVKDTIYSRITRDYEAAKQYYTDLGKWAELGELESNYKKYQEAYANSDEGKKVVGNNGLTKSQLMGKVADWGKQGLSKTEVLNQMKDLGVSAGEGYLDGYEDYVKQFAGSTSKTTVGTTTEKTADAQKSKSPSKVFAELGRYAGEGYLLGMEEVVNGFNANGMVDGLVTRLRTSILPAIASLTGNSIPFGGVTPVNFGLNQNGSGIYETDLPINEALPYDTHLMNITAILQKHSDNMMNQTNTIIEELDLLRGDVGDLANHIDNLEFRLDSDAIVGGLTPKLNNSLLKYSRRVERGL